jgi:hypothetical protein
MDATQTRMRMGRGGSARAEPNVPTPPTQHSQRHVTKEEFNIFASNVYERLTRIEDILTRVTQQFGVRM